MLKMNYSLFLETLASKTPFAFSRWGDGEWLNLKQYQGQNCDGNVYYKDLGEQLEAIIKSPCSYYLGCQDHPGLTFWREEYPQNWFDSDFLHTASIERNLNHFINILNKNHVVYIGNADLSKLSFINEFIEIPHNNVWLKKDLLLNQIQSTLNDKHKIYCFSAGMAANVFIHELWNVDNTNTYLDVGSVFDPYVGKKTRQYHHKLPLFDI